MTYTLANANGTSVAGRVHIEVRERPDPSRDAEVTGQLDAQARFSRQAASAQIANVLRHLEAVRSGQGNGSIGISLSPDDRRGPGFDPTRDSMVEELRRATAPPVRAGQDAAAGRSSVPSDGPVNVWVGGAMDLGRRREQAERAGFKFTTSGLSAGVDSSLSDRLTIGAGVGYGRDEAKIGDNGTKSDGQSVSIFGYGSYHPSRTTFLDGVLGVGRVSFDNSRFVTTTGGMVESQRQGDQAFGAISAGYEYRGSRLFVSPYGRIEFSWSDLNAYTETGDETFALRVAKQKIRDLTASVGVHGSYLFELKDGDLSPTFRLEYRQRLQSADSALITYADWGDSPQYTAKVKGYDESNVILGLGAEWRAISGWHAFVDGETTVLNGKGYSTRVRAGGATKF